MVRENVYRFNGAVLKPSACKLWLPGFGSLSRLPGNLEICMRLRIRDAIELGNSSWERQVEGHITHLTECHAVETKTDRRLKQPSSHILVYTMLRSFGAALTNARMGMARLPWTTSAIPKPTFSPIMAALNVRHKTINQILRDGGRPVAYRRRKSPDLESCPQRKGVVLRVLILKPKKPNSAQRKAARVRLSNGKVVTAYIPGEGHNAQEHSVVYVRGGRAQDTPGVKYHLIRGAGDLGAVPNRVSSRSKYGTKKPAAPGA